MPLFFLYFQSESNCGQRKHFLSPCRCKPSLHSSNRILIKYLFTDLSSNWRTTLVPIVFAMFQIPNLKNNFIFRPYGIWMIILAAVFYALSYPLLGMLVYSWSSKDKQRAKTVKKVLNLLSAVLVLLTLYNLYQTRNLGESIINVFNSPIAKVFSSGRMGCFHRICRCIRDFLLNFMSELQAWFFLLLEFP